VERQAVGDGGGRGSIGSATVIAQISEMKKSSICARMAA
jgi:hypothetical protein